MPKYLVETVSVFRMRYVIEAECAQHAKDDVVMNYDGRLKELSQEHLDEIISSAREIDRDEYLRLFDEDNPYMHMWNEDEKLNLVNVIDYEALDQ